jgi:enamine deaminase RidA (YjgF/YER057c/UK114 family)
MKVEVSVGLGEFQGGGKEHLSEYHVILSVSATGAPFKEQLEAVQAESLKVAGALGGRALVRRYFASDAANQAEEIRNGDAALPPCAVSLIQQPPANGTKVALWMYLVSAGDVRMLAPDVLEAVHGSYRQLWITSMTHPAGKTALTQASTLFRNYNARLAANGGTLALNCLRTWLFVRDIDLRYADVVHARTAFFDTHGLTKDTHYITSTGIEGRTACTESFVMMDALAVDGLTEGQITFVQAPDYLNRTSDYGVTFERGTAVTYGDRRHIFISGTASINDHGEVLYPGDVLHQAERALQNIEALLHTVDAGLADIKQAIVYLRDHADYHAVSAFLSERLKNHLIVIAPVCRPAWLIEIECIAITPTGDPRYPNL